MSKVFVFDLDGVIRHWDPDIVRYAERTHGLPEAALLGVAFEPDLLLRAVTGKISDYVWRKEVTRRLQAKYPQSDAAGAVASWSDPVGEVIEGSLEVLAMARRFGPVCLLSNATSRLESDLAALGLEDVFDHIFNSSRIGYAKPDQRVFAHIEQSLDVDPGQIIYVDDGPENVETASDRGWISLLAAPGTRLADLLQPHLR